MAVGQLAAGLLAGRPERRSRRRAGRHADLRSVLAWSTDLLDGEERAVWRRLSVFEGGFTAEADDLAETIRAVAPGDPITVARLDETNMIRAERHGDFAGSHAVGDALRAADVDDRSWSIATALQTHHFAALDPPTALALIAESVDTMTWSDLAVALLVLDRTNELEILLEAMDESETMPTLRHYVPMLRGALAAQRGDEAGAVRDLDQAAGCTPETSATGSSATRTAAGSSRTRSSPGTAAGSPRRRSS